MRGVYGRSQVVVRYNGFPLGKEMRLYEINPAASVSLAIDSGSQENRCVPHLQSEHPKPFTEGVIPHSAAI